MGSLSAILELDAAMSSGDPEAFVSSLPVYMDGSCNGLQHYAALGRDQDGAKAVNLTYEERPQDVYTVVLGKVIEQVKRDADNEHAAAKACIHHDALQRKVVKQTVMTICYGVTRLGAKEQVKRQLMDRLSLILSEKEITPLAAYLSGVVLASIDEVFAEAMRIKKWFDHVSSVMSANGLGVMWMSPAGVPCRQPYKKHGMHTLQTSLQTISLARTKDMPVHKMRQRMGFPPNFIHSMDAAHMFRTAERCSEEGLTFAAVHDSFWTHAADVSVMNTIIREEFEGLHGRPILEDLHEDLQLILGANASDINDLPPCGDYNLSDIHRSKYAFD